MTKIYVRCLSFVAMFSVSYGCGDTTKRAAPDAGDKSDSTSTPEERFSFFVTSYAAIERLSGSEHGFGGDLRYGEDDGLAGADKICTEIAESSMPGSGSKRWRAFLSVTGGPEGTPIDARDRIGDGPWYDRLGRLVAQNLSDLLHERPLGADSAIADDLPNEDGVPNHAPDGQQVDNHDILTGSNAEGRVYKADDWGSTCHDWTSAEGKDGRPRVGHSWPRRIGGAGGFPDPNMFFGDGGMPDPAGLCADGGALSGFCIDGGLPDPTMFFGMLDTSALCADGGFLSSFCVDGKLPGLGGLGGDGGIAPGGFGGGGDFSGANWISALDEAGCAPGASLIEMGPPNPNQPTVGSGGGYGGFYCFALAP